MPWLRVSDTVAMHPIVLAVAEHPDADERTADELFGFISRLATLSAQHTTDYISSYATALSIAGSKARTDRLLAQAEFAGYGWNEEDTDTGRRRFRLLDDPQFLHMKTAEEVEFERQRKLDNANPYITALVRLRDGDACRYCGKVVSWSDRVGGKGGTYDHRPPGEPAKAETAVVACKSCNSARGALCQGMKGQAALEAADAVVPLLEVPPEPYYKPATRTFLAKHSDILKQHGLTPPPPAKTKRIVPAGQPAPGSATPRPATQTYLDQASSADTAPQQERPAAQAQEGATQPHQGANGSTDTAPPMERPAAPQAASDAPSRRSPQIDGLPILDGPGRVGSGRDGLAQDGDRTRRAEAGSPISPARKRRRGRRGGKSKPRPQTNPQAQAPLSREDHTR